MKMKIEDVKVGEWYVPFAMGSPCQCNSQFSPNHPCRVKIEKVGRSRVYGKLSGSNTPKALALTEEQSGLLIVSVKEAKKIYRTNLENREKECGG